MGLLVCLIRQWDTRLTQNMVTGCLSLIRVVCSRSVTHWRSGCSKCRWGLEQWDPEHYKGCPNREQSHSVA